MRTALFLCFSVLAAVACNSPRPPETTKGKRAEPVTRGNPAPVAENAPAPEPVTRPAPSSGGAECVLTFAAPGVIFDCSFPSCPRDLLAHLFTADTVSFSRTGEVWLLNSSRKEPPFSPAGKTLLNVYAQHGEMHVPGIPTASCPLPQLVRKKLETASTIDVTSVQVRRTLAGSTAR